MQDHKQELMLIKELMDKLVDEMEPSASDFEERLGRSKPEIKSVEIEGVIPEMEDPLEEEDLDEDMMEDEMEPMMSEQSPEDELKKRIMKLRG